MNASEQTFFPLFPTLVYQESLLRAGVLTMELKNRVAVAVEGESNLPQHPLEVGNAVSTWHDHGLETSNEIEPLRTLVLDRANKYWEQLGYDRTLTLVIARAWANAHGSGGMTMEHSHSPVHVNAVFYLQVPTESGDLLLRSPLEYHLGSIPFDPTRPDRLWHRICVKTGDLIIIPGWLKHRTERSRAVDQRIVLTFNIFGRRD